MNIDEPTQQTAPDQQLPVGEVSFSAQQEGLVTLIGSVGMSCSWALLPDKQDLSWTFGRGARADFQFPASKKRLSSMHFRIWASRDTPPTIMMQDTSTNGTFLNNVRIPKGRNCMLMNGDVITVGLGVAADEIKFVVSIPKTSKAAPQGGVYEAYDFGELVGQGAFALVRQAARRDTGERVAVKIIDRAKVTGSLANAVEREIEILKRLRHENIVALHDIYDDEKHYYLVMDYVPHGDLMDHLLSRQTPEEPGIPERMSREIVRQVLRAVQYVHAMGISHRDLKPDNILINSFDPVSIKVADFGLAKLQAQGTFLKTFCGTLSYLAPEVLLSRHQSEGLGMTAAGAETGGPNGASGAAGGGGGASQGGPRPLVYTRLVDIWSIGCLAYVILTGCMPFGGSTQEELYRTVLAGEYHRGPLEAANVSPLAKSFISTLLDINTDTRPQAEQALRHAWFSEAGDDAANAESQASVLSSAPASLRESQSRALDRSSVCGFSSLDLTSMHGAPAPPPNTAIQDEGGSNGRGHGSEAGRELNGNVSEDGDDDLSKTREIENEYSDLDNEEDRRRVDFVASQQRDASQYEPRDIEDVEGAPDAAARLPVPDSAWGALVVPLSSLPAKDVFMTKATFTIGRCSKKDRRVPYDGPDLDYALEDARLSRTHCRFVRETTPAGTTAVWLEAYHFMYVNTTVVPTDSRTRVYDGDKICLFAAQLPTGGFDKLIFTLNLLGDAARFDQFKRPANARKNPPIEEVKPAFRNASYSESTSMALPAPDTPFKSKRERSDELVPAPKRLNTVFE